MAAALQLGVDEIAVHVHFEHSAIGGDEGDGFDIRFKGFQQFSRQTDGARGVMSNNAVFDSDDHVEPSDELVGLL